MPTYSFKACAIFKGVGEREAESLEEARVAIDSLSDKLRQPVVAVIDGGDGQSLGVPRLWVAEDLRLITSDLWVEEGDHELA